jgi:hypothetical protein
MERMGVGVGPPASAERFANQRAETEIGADNLNAGVVSCVRQDLQTLAGGYEDE